MSKYLELPFNKKLNLLREHEISGDWPDLDFEKSGKDVRISFADRRRVHPE